MSPADGVDWYDIQAMIRDARSEIRAEIADAVRELRDELGAERVERQDAIESLQRVLDARTERFV